jgi:hypothetical protein
VRDVDARAGLAGQREVAEDHDLLGGAVPSLETEHGGDDALVHDPAVGEIQVLAMIDHRNAEHRRVLQRLAEERPRDDRPSVVGDRHGPSRDEIADLGELFPLRPLLMAPMG